MSQDAARTRSTLVIIYDATRILLGMKKRGFGAGRWNGFGGKVTKGESIEAAAQRELEEEAGVRAPALVKRGVHCFSFEGKPGILQVHVLSGAQIGGTPVETEEMRPQWFAHADIPYADMWPDDRYWLPLLLDGKSFNCAFHFADENKLLSHVCETGGVNQKL